MKIETSIEKEGDNYLLIYRVVDVEGEVFQERTWWTSRDLTLIYLVKDATEKFGLAFVQKAYRNATYASRKEERSPEGILMNVLAEALIG